MKLNVVATTGLFVSLTCQSTDAISTMRVGPVRRNMIRGNVAFEFGRPLDLTDANAAFQEMKYTQKILLIGNGSYSIHPGMSLPFPGMSLPNPGMSFSYPGMSIPYPGMSFTHFYQSPSISPNNLAVEEVSPTPSPDSPRSNDCTPRDLTSSAVIQIQLEVETVSKDNLFVDALAQDIESFGEVHFSLCRNDESGNNSNRLLLENDTFNSTITGLDVTASTLGNTQDTCTSQQVGAFCTITDLTLTVYSASEDSSDAAKAQMYNELMLHQLKNGTFVKGGIVAIRFYSKPNDPIDSSAVAQEGNPAVPSRAASDSSMSRKLIISLFVLLVAVVAMALGVVYRKRIVNQKQQTHENTCGVDDDSRSESAAA